MASLYAATYPESTDGLVLYHPWLGRSDTRIEVNPESPKRFRESWGTNAGADDLLSYLSPTLAGDEEFRSWFRNWLRLSASPAGAYEFNRMIAGVDFRDVYPAVHVPTLVMYREYRPDAGEIYGDVARLIPEARLVSLPGNDYMGLFLDEPAREIEAFLKDRPARDEPNRTLLTVLFTDLVNSTARLAELGDAAWRELMEQHHRVVRSLLDRHRGREIDTAGDGFFAAFDGPARAIRCARAICEETARLGLEIRIGAHTGECEIVDDKPGGLAVVVGARVSSQARAGEVLVSGTLKDLVAGSGIAFEERGEHELKGVPGNWRLYAVVDA